MSRSQEGRLGCEVRVCKILRLFLGLGGRGGVTLTGG